MSQILNIQACVSGEVGLCHLGAKPSIQLARDAGLRIEEVGSIWVDEYMRTSATIFACCVKFTQQLQLGPPRPSDFTTGSIINRRPDHVAAVLEKLVYWEFAAENLAKV